MVLFVATQPSYESSESGVALSRWHNGVLNGVFRLRSERNHSPTRNPAVLRECRVLHRQGCV